MNSEELAEKLIEQLKKENIDIFESNKVDLTYWKDIEVAQLYIALLNYTKK